MIGDADDRYLLASDAGYGFVARLGDLFSKNKAGKAVLTRPNNAGVLTPQAVGNDDDGWVAVVTSSGYLLVTELEELPLLGMAEDDVRAPGILQHGRGDLASEGPARLGVHVLSCQEDARALEGGSDRHERGEGRRHKGVHPGGVCTLGDLARQSHSLRDLLVHLPVGGQDRSRHSALQCSYTRKCESLDVFQRSAAAGRKVGDLGTDTRLVDGRKRVTAAHHGATRAGSHRVGEVLGAACEGIDLEDPHGSVPKAGARLRHCP